MKRLLIASLIAMLCLTLVACTDGGKNPAPSQSDLPQSSDQEPHLPQLTKETMKVGFIYESSIGDEGYTYMHNLGRLALEDMGIKTMYIENVPESSDCEKAANDLIDQGCNVIYGISFGFGEYLANVAAERKDVYFGHATGYLTSDNMNTFMGRIYEPHYLAGIAAGLRTETNKIGFVTTFPIPECVRMINAYMLGVRSVNPEATVEVKWTSSWVDPAAEKAASVELLNTGCDVIAGYSSTLNPQMAAAEQGKWSTGISTPGYHIIPNSYLTAPLMHYSEFYKEDVQRILDGKWTGNNQYWLGLETGIVALDDISDNCKVGTKEKVETAKQAIIDGSFFVFSGPLTDNEGVLRIGEGERLSDEDLLALDWFVEGVIGSVK